MVYSTMKDLHHLTDFISKFEVPKTKWQEHPEQSEGPDDDSQCDQQLSITEEQ